MKGGPAEQLGMFDGPAVEARVAAQAREAAHHVERYGLPGAPRRLSAAAEAELLDVFRDVLGADGGELV